MTQLPAAVSQLVSNSSLGLFHTEAGGQFGFYYMLSRSAGPTLPVNSLLRPFLDVQLPDGIGMTFTKRWSAGISQARALPRPGATAT